MIATTKANKAKATLREAIAKGDLLYHAVHGLCRMDRVIKQYHPGKGEILCYSLVPKATSRMKERFIVAMDDIEAAGFHLLISVKEANKILKYLKDGDSSAVPSDVVLNAQTSLAEPNQTWGLAQVILTSSCDKFEIKDQRKRQALERSAKGLVGELAFVFKTTPKEIAAMVQKSLGSVSKINRSVLVALAHASED